MLRLRLPGGDEGDAIVMLGWYEAGMRGRRKKQE